MTRGVPDRETRKQNLTAMARGKPEWAADRILELEDALQAARNPPPRCARFELTISGGEISDVDTENGIVYLTGWPVR